MNFAFIILSILNIIAELTELSYDLGRVTRKHLVPVLVGTYVLVQMGWEALTEMEMDINFGNMRLAGGFA